MYDEAMGTMTQNHARKNKLDEEEFQGKRFKAKKRKKTFKRKRKFKFRKKPLKFTKNNPNELFYDSDNYIMGNKNNSNELFYNSDDYIMSSNTLSTFTII